MTAPGSTADHEALRKAVETPAQLRAVTAYAPAEDLHELCERMARHPGIDGEVARIFRDGVSALLVKANDHIRFHCKHAKETA